MVFLRQPSAVIAMLSTATAFGTIVSQVATTSAFAHKIIPRRNVAYPNSRTASGSSTSTLTTTHHHMVASIREIDEYPTIRSPKMVSAKVSKEGQAAQISFSDGSVYEFHSLWLRDACRDPNHVEAQSERKLTASPIIARVPSNIGIQNIRLQEDGSTLSIDWDCGDLSTSTFSAGFIRSFSHIARKLEKEVISNVMLSPEHQDFSDFYRFFEFINGKDDTAMPKSEDLHLWDASAPDIRRIRYSDLRFPETHRKLLHDLMDPGVVIVEGMPPDVNLDGSVFSDFAEEFLGGLQKHPRRDASNWVISTQHDVGNSNMKRSVERSATNAYDTTKELCNHTDQSHYGLPGLLLGFHCVHGEGNNSLTDGFAVAYAMKERHPEHFEILTQYGMNAGRHLGIYAGKPLCFDTNHPVFHVDAAWNMKRVQYHETYRTPLTVPYEKFHQYWAALDYFYSLVHSEEFQTKIKIQNGQCLLMNNWRAMHGRAGLKGKRRTIIGGTVSREAFYSAVRQRAMKDAGVQPFSEVGIANSELWRVGKSSAVVESEMETFLLSGFNEISAREEISKYGYTVIRQRDFGPGEDIESVARKLLELPSDHNNEYNGRGGVSRPLIEGTSFLDVAEGAPPELKIQLHNEMAYAPAFPKMIAFAKFKQPNNDATTILVDNVQVTRMLSESLRSRLAKGVRYIRLLHSEAERNDPFFYASWQGAFQTDDLVKAIENGKQNGGSVDLIDGGRILKHTVWSPVFYTHPDHGELYFSSILNRHGSWLDDHKHFGSLPLQERPYQCVWADGSELTNTELEELRVIHNACTQRVTLEEGDLVVIDNLRVAHGRTPWKGGDRKMGMLLSELVERTH